ncbi:MAG: type II toxin-antitoxin system RelE/ParE family toxin [Lactobacillales bacterium]|jgi:addiction module RelE/StbE family toxin|nr:type II toxin-antitoxin system RelE/ParE family toxin [Lactobacillales bacterium]
MLQVKFTRLALKDLEDGHAYIYAENPPAAQQVITRIETALQKLQEYPYIGHKGRVDGTYELVVQDTPYIIVYAVDPERLKIVSILHTSRKFP